MLREINHLTSGSEDENALVEEIIAEITNKSIVLLGYFLE